METDGAAVPALQRTAVMGILKENAGLGRLPVMPAYSDPSM